HSTMPDLLTEINLPPQFPDHTQLPESDGTDYEPMTPNQRGHYPIKPGIRHQANSKLKAVLCGLFSP
ncbi:MAG: hypothetical protein ACLFVV_17725, partial [Coleofasciculus sp.]